MSEIDIERALNFIRDIAPKHAESKANRIYIEQYRKSKKAMLITEAPEGTVQSKESYAYRHPEYIELLEGLKAAGIAQGARIAQQATPHARSVAPGPAPADRGRSGLGRRGSERGVAGDDPVRARRRRRRRRA